ncbi:RlmF-related methyltransferase [Pyrococcus abyssi]|uniref:Methyltransferase related protein n=1 Tax=Pyrococcus abyssi (strain GE5 / Orsay) TaxID=272844 RepID=Q9V232_PYRAB|nr:RlmF-related methyltransferase [Pyrococcus abyssi]CAB49166.1 SAM-dependent methyltransferase, putative [Pyrococcus abyssi GE5]CCE69618.1 TPA: methyltransferase related protein [Pyrococcus abyssi GE5]
MPSWKDGKLGLPIRDALQIFPELREYVDEKGRLDFSNRRARILYNKAIAKAIFGLDIEYHPRGLVTTPISRYIFLKTFLRGGERVLEIGTGHTAMMALMAAKIFNCEVTATEIDEEFFTYAKDNIERNGAKVRLIKSNGGIIRDVIPEGEKFDVIFSAPPYYDKPTRGVLTYREGVGGGKYGERFSIKLLKEAYDYLSKDGKVALFLPDKEPLIVVVAEKGKEIGYLVRDVRFKVGTRWRHSLIFLRA